MDEDAGSLPSDDDYQDRLSEVSEEEEQQREESEESEDGGLTWHLATLEPPLSQDAWVFWTWQWTPTVAGQFTIAARATDGTGEVQTSHKQGTVPNGATGYHEIVVEVG